MKPEQLKQIAEWLRGYAEIRGNAQTVFVYHKIAAQKTGIPYEAFNPETNAEQREEILLGLLDAGWDLHTLINPEAYELSKHEHHNTEAPTYPEALMNAALKEVE